MTRRITAAQVHDAAVILPDRGIWARAAALDPAPAHHPTGGICRALRSEASPASYPVTPIRRGMQQRKSHPSRMRMLCPIQSCEILWHD